MNSKEFTTADLIVRLRDYDSCNDSDVDEAANRLEYLQKIVDEIPELIGLIAADCGVDYVNSPTMYQRGELWRYHKVRAGNYWNDGDTPLSAVRFCRNPIRTPRMKL